MEYTECPNQWYVYIFMYISITKKIIGNTNQYRNTGNVSILRVK